MPDTNSRSASGAGNGRDRIAIDFACQLLSGETFGEKLSILLDIIVREMKCDKVALALRSSSSDRLRIEAVAGFPSRTEGVEWPVSPTGRPSELDRWGSPLWIDRDDSENSAMLIERLEHSGPLLSLPMRTRAAAVRGLGNKTPDSWIGVIIVGPDRRPIGHGQLDLFDGVAELAGAVLANSQKILSLETAVTALRYEQEWNAAILESVADPIVLTNLDNEILLQNKSAESFLSASEDATEGRLRAVKMNDLLFSAYLSSAGFSPDQIGRGDLTLVDPDEGDDVHFEVVSTPTRQRNDTIMGRVSIFRNVTDLRSAHEEVMRNYRQAEESSASARIERDRLNSIIENVGDPVVVSDQFGSILLCNRRADEFFHEESRWAAGPVQTNSIRLTSFITNFASEPDANRQAEIILLDPATRDPIPMEVSAVKIRDDLGELSTVVSVLHNLSEIRELERRRVEQKLLESQKLAAIGRLTASIAHEINNPLEAVKNALFLAREKDDGPARNRFLELAATETERMSRTVTQMLGFARSSEGTESVDLRALLDETLGLVSPNLRHLGIQMEKFYAESVPLIEARPDQLRQVFLNLLLNAQQAIEGVGKISVRIDEEQRAGKKCIVVEVTDTGCGIAEADISRVFEPFYSAGKKKGTGLGLWVTQDVVQAHGGTVEVTSAVNRGTSFRVVLPIPAPDARSARKENSGS